MARLVPSLLLLLFLPSSLSAAGPDPGLPLDAASGSGETVRAVEIVDGDTLVLEDGRQLRLVGIQAPPLPTKGSVASGRLLAEAATAVLQELALGKTLRLSFGGRRMDRHGRLLAQAYAADGRWLQGELLRRGLARVYTFADNRALVAEMLRAEAEARAAQRGIWADPLYRVRRPEEMADALDSYQIVEGRVRAAAVVRGRGYLNFGQDWHTDFTLALDPEALRAFETSEGGLAALAGRDVRARGWVKSFNGPLIAVTHPEQIELLPSP